MKALLVLFAFIAFLALILWGVVIVLKIGGKKRTKWYLELCNKLEIQFIEPLKMGEKHLARGTVSGVPIVIFDKFLIKSNIFKFSISVPADSFDYNFFIGPRYFTAKFAAALSPGSSISVNKEFDSHFLVWSNNKEKFTSEFSPLIQEKIIANHNKMKNSSITGDKNQIIFNRHLKRKNDMYPPVEEIEEIVQILLQMRASTKS